MRILVVGARRPNEEGRGDQKRAAVWSRELAALGHDVTLLTLGLPDDEPAAGSEPAGVRWVQRSSPAWRRALRTLLGLLRGVPLQASWTIGARAGEVRQLAAQHDIVLAVTTRVLDRPLPVPVVVDHVDALSLNMQRRAAIDEHRLRRIGARLEERLMRRHEQRLAGWLAAQIITTAPEAAVLPQQPRPVVVPAHFTPTARAFAEPQSGGRPVDVILTGNMQYPPNRRAYDHLTGGVLPALQAAQPGVRVRVVGRRADTLEPRPGVEIAADVPSVEEELRAAKIAIAPVHGGTGGPTKLLEAGAAGCAVVAPQWALDAFGIEVVGAEDDAQTADQLIALLGDDEARRRNAEAVAAATRRCAPAALTAEVERVLLAAAAPQP